jgi:hypothetical protein
MYSSSEYDSYGISFFDALTKGSKEFLVEVLVWGSMFKDLVRENGSLMADLILLAIFSAGLALSAYLFVDLKVHSQYFSFTVIVLVLAVAVCFTRVVMPRDTRDPGVEYAPLN